MSDPTKLCDLDAERALLGSMMMAREAIDEVLPIVGAQAFYSPPHVTLFRALVALHAQGKPMDFIVVNDHLKAAGLLDEIGGPDYMVHLAESFADWSNAAHYARIVRDKSVRRDLWRIGQSLCRKACDELNEPDIDAVAAAACKEADDAVQTGRADDVESVDDLVARLPAWFERESAALLPTGFRAIDDRIGGLWRPGYVIIAARPSVGKTSLGLTFANHIVRWSKVPALFCSLETPKMRVAARVYAIETGVPIGVHRNNPPGQFEQETASFGRRYDAKLYVADTLFGIGPIAARARSMIRQKKVGLVVIDYLQLVEGDAKAQSRQLEIQGISRTLRMLANQHDATVIALCQLNREAVAGQRPGLHNLRESGAIEQDADQVFFIYHGGHAAQVCIDLGKNRDGPLGSWQAEFRGSITSFVRVRDAGSDATGDNGSTTQEASYASDIPF